MIKFFRKFRQNMLAANKFGKYLIYALGEIVLVMLGILLALQVNNWNESRKEYLIEVELVGLLISDLEEKRQENRNDLSAANRFINDLQPILNTWKKNYKIDTTNLKTSLTRLGYDFYFLNENSPLYSTLSSTNLWRQIPDT